MSSLSVETPNPVRDPLLLNDDSSDGHEKHNLAVGDHEIERRDPPGTVREQPLRRFWVRPLVLILIPTIVTVYYGIIWIYLVLGTDNDDTVKYRTYSGSLIYYSWFLIGIFGLSWSKYGLVGVEASMLRDRYWAAPNLVSLLMHSNGTWASPSGWVKAIIHREFSRLWCLLTFISILPFIAFPLSGLVFEISDGFIQVHEAPLVIGRNSSNVNERYDISDGYINSAERAWGIGALPIIPGFGVVYTPKSVDRGEHPGFEKLPNTMPESIPDLFLAPQSDKAVSGRAWGLRVKYNCSVVRDASEFTILSQKPASSIYTTTCFGLEPNQGERACVKLLTPSEDTITLFNTSQHNTFTHYEIGLSNATNSKPGYVGGHPDFEAGEGVSSAVFEYAAWQVRRNAGYTDSDKFWNSTVGDSIKGMGDLFIRSDDGSFSVNSTFFAIKGDVIENAPYQNRTTDAADLLSLENDVVNSELNLMLEAAPPIGVRCVASSGMGLADIDGTTSTFANYERADPFVRPIYRSGPPPFGHIAQLTLERGRFHQHHESGHMPPREALENTSRYRGYVSSQGLLRSISTAYAWEAIDIIYGVAPDFEFAWPEPRLTYSRDGKILAAASLVPGSAMGYFVFALFVLWAGLSLGLGLWYGFRKMPTDKLDGYVMLRKGAGMADELKENADFMAGKSAYSSGLQALPGS